jgi:hypothetical protein
LSAAIADLQKEKEEYENGSTHDNKITMMGVVRLSPGRQEPVKIV